MSSKERPEHSLASSSERVCGESVDHHHGRVQRHDKHHPPHEALASVAACQPTDAAYRPGLGLGSEIKTKNSLLTSQKQYALPAKRHRNAAAKLPHDALHHSPIAYRSPHDGACGNRCDTSASPLMPKKLNLPCLVSRSPPSHHAPNKSQTYQSSTFRLIGTIGFAIPPELWLHASSCAACCCWFCSKDSSCCVHGA